MQKFDFKVSTITASAQEQWDCYDKLGKDQINFDAFLKVQSATGSNSADDLKAMFDHIDINKDGLVSFEEYLQAMLEEQL